MHGDLRLLPLRYQWSRKEVPFVKFHFKIFLEAQLLLMCNNYIQTAISQIRNPLYGNERSLGTLNCTILSAQWTNLSFWNCCLKSSSLQFKQDVGTGPDLNHREPWYQNLHWGKLCWNNEIHDGNLELFVVGVLLFELRSTQLHQRGVTFLAGERD